MQQSNSDILYSGELVSIVMCTYNGAEYIREQLDSIIHQTYQHLEIVIVDDNSADTTPQIIEEYKQRDSRINFYQNKERLGYNKNFEKAIGLASAGYIAISDQDDIWELHKIETILKAWPENSLFVYSLSGNFSGADFSGKTPAPKVHYSDISNVLKLVFNSPVHGHACMFKRELLKQCLPFPDDIFYDWWMSMHAASISTIGYIPQNLTWHRVHDSNSSRTLTSIENKEEKNNELRLQSIHFIESFCSRDVARKEEQKVLLEYATLLKKVDGKKFSFGMFNYVMKHRHLIFHYKKKPFAFFSHIKHAYKMGYKGLL
jgi:glycosyltransferase involved in cell wall biosynthesis